MEVHDINHYMFVAKKVSDTRNLLQCLLLSPSPTCLHSAIVSPCYKATPDESPWKTQSLDPIQANVISVSMCNLNVHTSTIASTGHASWQNPQ